MVDSVPSEVLLHHLMKSALLDFKLNLVNCNFEDKSMDINTDL